MRRTQKIRLAFWWAHVRHSLSELIVTSPVANDVLRRIGRGRWPAYALDRFGLRTPLTISRT